jgi:hypothetical protein
LLSFLFSHTFFFHVYRHLYDWGGHFSWVSETTTWIAKHSANHPIVVGEWSAAMAQYTGSKTGNQEFLDAELSSFNQAWGWYYWNFKVSYFPSVCVSLCLSGGSSEHYMCRRMLPYISKDTPLYIIAHIIFVFFIYHFTYDLSVCLYYYYPKQVMNDDFRIWSFESAIQDGFDFGLRKPLPKPGA